MNSRRLAIALGLLLGGEAWAGACCVGSTTAVPTRLGPCERVVLAGVLGGETSFARWKADGALVSASSWERSAIGSLGVGVGLSRKWQLGASLPTYVNARGSAAGSSLGGGPGDARLTATWVPWEERASTPDRRAPPNPVFTAGLRLPTGRTWAEARDPAFADVTGLPGAAAILGAQVERTMGQTPMLLALTAELGAADGTVAPTVDARVGVGRTLGQRFTVMGTAGHTASWVRGGERWARAARTSVGGRVITGRSLRWRAWGAVELDVPAPQLGADRMLLARASAGAALVR